ncbi:arylsulfatase [Novosphingobium sp. PS1R-30]|uniref:Arylsulfatase n=1 Tax=Novosphingobium anseongense TaxID=3133436 RepID=A0ABU8S0R3_9SPHN
MTRLSLAVVLLCASALATPSIAQEAPGGVEGFTGKLGPTMAQSIPAFPKPPEAPKAAPNVLLILLDDVGFAATSTFGGGARTPHLDGLAANGLRYNRFHTTAICSPTRAALLTGRNHHQVGFGNLADVAAGFPAYNSNWKRKTASIARILQLNGYSTAAIGKWHNTPRWEVTAAGPFDRWPTRLGFDHFYGFQGGEDNQWEPHLYNDTTPIEPPATPEQGYHLTTDLVDKTVAWVDDHAAVAAKKPYFVYFAPGATHTPHHVSQEWIARNKGRFDGGWDRYREEAFARQKRLGVVPADTKLTPRPEGLPAWSSLSDDERRLYARQMEVFSAFLEETDAEVGRLVETLRARPGGENLLVLYVVGDNGGSAEGGVQGSIANEGGSASGAPHDVATQLANIDKFGGPELSNHFSAGWAWTTTTPFQWVKQAASHFGGTRNPLIVNWPGHTAQPGKVRSQFGHVNDIAPTILDAAGIGFPEEVDGVRQVPFEGKSLVASFTNPAAPEKHTEQYFEIFGNRAIYKDGWVAAAKRKFAPWQLLENLPRAFGDDTATDRWELYNVAKDFSEANDLAQTNPAKLEELKAEFVREGQRNGVFPLLPIPLNAPAIVDTARRSFTFRPDIGPLQATALPDLGGQAHRFEVDIKDGASTGSGALIAQGGRLGGFVLYTSEGRLVFENNAFGQKRDRVVSSVALPAGAAKVGFEFTPAAGGVPRLPIFSKPAAGTVRLFVDGKQVGAVAVQQYPTSVGSFAESFDIGRDRGSPVSGDEAARRPYSGSLGEVRLELK